MRPDRMKQMMAHLTRPGMARGGRIGFQDAGLAKFANPNLGKEVLKKAKKRRQIVKQGLLDDYSDFLKNRKLFKNEKYVPVLSELRKTLNADESTIKKVIKELPKNIQKNIQPPKTGDSPLKKRGLTDAQLDFFSKNYKDKSLMQMTQELIGDKNINYENPKFKNLYAKLFRFNKYLVDRGVIEGVPRTFAKKIEGVPELRNKGQAFRKYEEAQKALMKLDPKTYGKYNTPAGLDSALKKMINYKQVRAATGNLPDDLLLSFEHYQGLTPGFITQDPTALSKVGLTGRKYNWQIMGKDGKYSPYTTVKRYLGTAKELIKKNKIKEAKEALKKVNIVYDDIQKELKTVGRKELPKYNIKNNKIIETNLKGVFKQQTLDKSFEGYFKNIAGFATKEDLAAVKKVQPNVAKVLNLYQQGKTKEASNFIKKRVPQITETTRYGNIAIKPGELFANPMFSPGVLGEAFKTIPTPLGAVGLTAGFGVDPTSALDRASIAAEAAFAPALVKQSAKMGAAQRLFNLGFNPRMAMRIARVASPLGIASLAGEGVYQAGKFAKKRIGELKAMSPEERQELRRKGDEFAFSEFAAAGGGIAKQAGDSSGRPPESGPNPQGLQGLMKRVRNR